MIKNEMFKLYTIGCLCLYLRVVSIRYVFKMLMSLVEKCFTCTYFVGGILTPTVKGDCIGVLFLCDHEIHLFFPVLLSCFGFS